MRQLIPQRQPAATTKQLMLQRKCACGNHRNVGECGECTEKKGLLQRKAGDNLEVAEVPAIVHDVLRSPAQPLDAGTRAFMEPRFAHDFSRIQTQSVMPQTSSSDVRIGPPDDHYEREADHIADRITHAAAPAIVDGGGRSRYDLSGVRVHTGALAAQSARAINAQAYTVGSHIVFAESQYAPSTSAARQLLAHELAHVIQQGGAANRVQRRLLVDGPDASMLPDPASTIPRATRAGMVQTLVQNLCDNFVVSSSGPVDEVLDPGNTCDHPKAVTSGVKPTGCCCLCIMVNAANTWTIRVVQNTGANTLFPDVVIPPSTSVVESMGWTSGPSAHIVNRPRQITLGHELCGHAALMEIGAHPRHDPRTTSDVHDPTVKIERLIWGEQGLPASEKRGLAASGVHRGESLSRVTVSHFSFDSSDITRLPAAEFSKIAKAREFIVANNWFVDVLGHSDPVGTPAAKMAVSAARATAVRTELERPGSLATISRPALGLGTVSRFTRVAGVGDSQPLPAGTPHAAWRRADILMANFPAGSQVPPPGTPTTVSHAPPESTFDAILATFSSDSCVRHMARGAWS